jgi:hypothetical protein
VELARTKAVRGDKLRDMLFLIYMHNKFSKDKIKVADLKKIVGYSAGGAYSAFESPYIAKKGEEIHLTEEGEEYVKNRILPHYDIYKSYGNVLIFLGGFFIIQWLEWTFLKIALIPAWYLSLMIVALGFFLRFFVLRFNFYITRKRKKIEY